jgi:hypothetical protein
MTGASPRKTASIATPKRRRDEATPASMVDVSISAGRSDKPACSCLLSVFTFDSFLIVKNQVSKSSNKSVGRYVYNAPLRLPIEIWK